MDHRFSNRNAKLQKNDTEIDSGNGPIDNKIEVTQTSSRGFTNTDRSSLPNLTTNGTLPKFETTVSHDTKQKTPNIGFEFNDSNIEVSKILMYKVFRKI